MSKMAISKAEAPHLNAWQRVHVATLQRRHDHVSEILESGTLPDQNGWLRSERAALRWALKVLRANLRASDPET
jgi:hypothetical protein